MWSLHISRAKFCFIEILRERTRKTYRSNSIFVKKLILSFVEKIYSALSAQPICIHYVFLDKNLAADQNTCIHLKTYGVAYSRSLFVGQEIQLN